MTQETRLVQALIAGLVIVAIVLGVLWLDASGRADSAANVQATAAAESAALGTEVADAADAANAASETQTALEVTLDAAQRGAQHTADIMLTLAREATQDLGALQGQLATAEVAAQLTPTAAFIEGMRVANATDFPIFTQAAVTLEAAQAHAAAQADALETAAAELATQQVIVEALQTEVASQYVPIYPTIVIIFETPTLGVLAGSTATPVIASPSPTLPPTPTPPSMALTPTASAPLALGATYIHPSGGFQIDPPAGWALMRLPDNDWSGRRIASAAWIDEDERMLAHAFVVYFDEPLTDEAARAYIEAEYESGFASYDVYEVIDEQPGDPHIVDFTLTLGGTRYLARQWVTIDDSRLAYLRVVVPAERAAMLAALGDLLLPYYHVFAVQRVEPAATTTLPPATVEPSGVVIARVGGVGALDAEFVELHNTGSTINLEGWTLCAERKSDCYTFGRFVLFPRGSVALYSRAGDDTPVALFWGRDAPAWAAGDVIVLRDAQGNTQAQAVAEGE